MRRSNKERTDATRGALLDAARELFTDKGYADTATPEIVAAAGVTRGALYHHFEDKRQVFRAVIEREAVRLTEDIRSAAGDAAGARAAMIAGTSAYFSAMAVPGRTRLLLIDGPAVLGFDAMRAIDLAGAEASLREGVAELLHTDGSGNDRDVEAAASLLSAAFDRAALEIDAGGDRAVYEAAVVKLIDGLTRR